MAHTFALYFKGIWPHIVTWSGEAYMLGSLLMSFTECKGPEKDSKGPSCSLNKR